MVWLHYKRKQTDRFSVDTINSNRAYLFFIYGTNTNKLKLLYFQPRLKNFYKNHEMPLLFIYQLNSLLPWGDFIFGLIHFNSFLHIYKHVWKRKLEVKLFYDVSFTHSVTTGTSIRDYLIQFYQTVLCTLYTTVDTIFN